MEAAQIIRTQEEIDNVLNAAAEGMDEGSKYPGMSFEEGIYQMYQWLTDAGSDIEPPLL